MVQIPPNQRAKSSEALPVPTHGSGGIFSVSCSTTIAAPALTCLGLILDTTTYPSWNSFCPRVVIDHAPSPDAAKLDESLAKFATRPEHLYPGVQMRFEAHLDANSASSTMVKLEVSFLERFERDGRTGYRVAWKVRGLPHFVQNGERVQEFVEGPAGEDGSVVTEYVCWETFGGLVSRLIPSSIVTQVEGGFNRWMDGLKGAAEEAAKAKTETKMSG